ncbi:hypothetical protein F511_43275 [Dorcoceras hygrometricum]|uniref:Uncharacterized protein n=1 Tax=Dorcoceras hygrometricum TaxID=472368 RepID=A0A2Z7C099_9LAMI|nr:hypothetical protein F511_43275 [Dorcoceras hygrometricum]
MDQQMREFRVTSCWFGKTVEEVERRRFVKLKRCILEPAARGFCCKSPAGSVVEFEKKPAVTNKEFSSWTCSKANPAADYLATQFQQQREIQQRRRLHLVHEKVRIPRREARSLYRKLHRGKSKRFLTHTRQTSRCNDRFRGLMVELLTQINAYVDDFVTVDVKRN